MMASARFAGRTVMVTGSSSGIGEGISEGIARCKRRTGTPLKGP